MDKRIHKERVTASLWGILASGSLGPSQRYTLLTKPDTVQSEDCLHLQMPFVFTDFCPLTACTTINNSDSWAMTTHMRIPMALVGQLPRMEDHKGPMKSSKLNKDG